MPRAKPPARQIADFRESRPSPSRHGRVQVGTGSQTCIFVVVTKAISRFNSRTN